MRQKQIVVLCSLLLSLSTALSSSAWAQNRQSSDAIFDEPRGSAVTQLMLGAGDLIAFYLIRPKLPAGVRVVSAEGRLREILQSNMTEEDKVKSIRQAEEEVANSRVAALRTLEGGAIPTVIKYVRIVGTTVVMVDVFMRGWVWSALNANPTWSPAVTTLIHNGEKLSPQYALPQR